MEEDKYQDEIAKEIEMQEAKSTDCDHYYLEGKTNGDLKDANCNKCFHGCQINKDIPIKDGKILWNK